jgi:hypothetical protein
MPENEFKTKVIEELSKTFPPLLANDLLSSYQLVITEYRKGHWDETLWKAGKFCENAFRLLGFLLNGQIEKEVGSIRDIREKIEKVPADKLPESIRILVPRIASALIYDPRSKKGAVHVKEINPDYLDASLVVTGCSWVLAEFIRTFHTADSAEIGAIVNGLMQRKVPFIEFHEGKPYITKPLECRNEVLLLLLSYSEGLSRGELGIYLGEHYSAGRITQAIDELGKKRHVLNVNEKYVISGTGEEEITKLLITFY